MIELQVFKQSGLRIVVDFVWIVVLAAIAYVLSHIFIPAYDVVIALAIASFGVYWKFVVENIYFELDGHVSRFFKRNQLVESMVIEKDTHVTKRVVTQDFMVSELSLFIDQKEFDCTSLGQATFYKLYEAVSSLTDPQIIKIGE